MSKLVFTVSFLAMFGCAGQKAAEPPKAAAGATTPATVAPPTAKAVEVASKACSADMSCGAGQLCVESKCIAITPELAACKMFTVHFPYDSAQLEATDRPEVDRIARCLRADQAMIITIEGDADERGTAEYNLSLGEKRALAVEKYLERAGVSPAQLKTVSFGKENPLCTEHSEECWQQNRRAASKIKESGHASMQ